MRTMDGLIIKPEWLKQIYEPVTPYTEPKTWEIRGNKTSKRGRIYLLESGSGLVTGETTIIDCVKINDVETWLANKDKHQVDEVAYGPLKMNGFAYAWSKYNGKIYAYVLKDTVKYETPIKYNKPKGAIIWVKNVETIMEH